MDNENKKYKVSLAISEAEGLPRVDFDKIDLLILGNPFCKMTPGNPLGSLELMEKSINLIGSHLDKTIVSLPLCPLENELSYIQDVLSLLSDMGVHGVEVHSPGMAMRVETRFPKLKIYFGSFANVYTVHCVEIMQEMGVIGGTLPYELNIDEIEFIHKNIDFQIWLPIFGPFPIAFSQYCFFHPGQVRYPFKCDHECSEEVLVDYGAGKKVLHKGRAIFSHRCLNMLKHLPMLLNKGFSHFRIEGLILDVGSLNEIVDIFHEHINKIIETGDKTTPEIPAPDSRLSKFSPRGFCNGFYFTRRGMDYVESVMDWDGRLRYKY
ncbi:MAG: U32 family peptidase [Candidatus Eremiobacteraeota bacterium]|nr:U32 family peptidase [Candidatus Eremiobacteraeota bacterium]